MKSMFGYRYSHAVHGIATYLSATVMPQASGYRYSHAVHGIATLQRGFFCIVDDRELQE